MSNNNRGGGDRIKNWFFELDEDSEKVHTYGVGGPPYKTVYDQNLRLHMSIWELGQDGELDASSCMLDVCRIPLSFKDLYPEEGSEE